MATRRNATQRFETKVVEDVYGGYEWLSTKSSAFSTEVANSRLLWTSYTSEAEAFCLKILRKGEQQPVPYPAASNFSVKSSATHFRPLAWGTRPIRWRFQLFLVSTQDHVPQLNLDYKEPGWKRMEMKNETSDRPKIRMNRLGYVGGQAQTALSSENRTRSRQNRAESSVMNSGHFVELLFVGKLGLNLRHLKQTYKNNIN